MNAFPTRSSLFSTLFPTEPAFRWRQIEEGLLKAGTNSWEDLTGLPKAMRERLAQEVPWISHSPMQVLSSKRGDTYKVLLKLEDGNLVETVLMENRRDQWTICVSSQVGCAMNCQFCATGKMGLTRSLNADEIIDQYRFWQNFLNGHPELPQRISNVVFMGMGEPLANYENVKATLHTWLKYTDIGPTHITVSTVGVLPVLEKILTDPEWPDVRLALSLHSAIAKTRKQIVPTSFEGFLPKLKDWIIRYQKTRGNRRHHLTFEYVMLRDVNDTDEHARALAKLVRDLGEIKVNLIPYNFTDMGVQCSLSEQIDRFKLILESGGAPVTLRKTMGDDIAAACGQLITLGGKK